MRPEKGDFGLKVLLQMDVMKLRKNLDIPAVYGYIFRTRGQQGSQQAKSSQLKS